MLFILMMGGVGFAQPHSSKQVIDRATEQYEMGQWVAAKLSLHELNEDGWQLTPSESEEVDYLLVMIAAKGDNSEIEHYFERFMRLYPMSRYCDQIHLEQALYLCEREEYDRALTALERINYDNLTPEQKQEYDIRMGYIAFYDRRYEDAAPYLERIRLKSELYPHALYYRSYISYADGSNAAREGFEQLLKSDAYADIAPFYLLHIDFRDGHYQRVIESGEELLKQSSPERSIEILRILAESYFKEGNFEQTIGYLSKYEATGGVIGREENYLIGFSLYRLARYAEAADRFRAASGADDALTQNASYHLADCYIRLGDRVRAKQSFALASNDTFDAQIAQYALFNYGKIEYEEGGGVFNEAINILTRYVESYPNGENIEEAKVLLIAAYYNSRDYDAAYNAISQISNPDAQIRGAQQKIALFRGVDAFNGGDIELARRSFQQAASINISPKYVALAYFWQGEILYMEGNYQAALNNYNIYVTRSKHGDEYYDLALFNIAYCHLMLGNRQEAESYFTRFTSLNGSSAEYLGDGYNRLGDINYGKRNFQQARSFYSLAEQGGAPYNHYALYNMAIIDGVLERYSSKEQILKSIIDAEEGSYLDAAYYELGRSYVAWQRYEDGVAQLERFINRYPTSQNYPQALCDLGVAHLNLGNRNYAIEYYDMAIKSAPNTTVAKDALLGIRSIYVNGGDADGYFSYAASMGVDGDLDAIARDSLSYASALQLYLYASGDYTRAVESLEGYLSSYKSGHNRGDALFLLSDCYIKSGDKTKAIERLNSLLEHGAGSYSERVYSSLSGLNFEIGEYIAAADAYSKLYSLTTSESTKRGALSGYIDASLASGSSEQTLAMGEFLANKRESISQEQARRVDYALAKVYSSGGERDKAFAIYNTLSADTQSVEGAEAAYIIIEDKFLSGSYDDAEKLILALSDSGTRHSYWLAKSFLVLGDIYIKRGDNFQARATYQSIVDGYSPNNDGVIEQAKSKIQNISE